jgi:hypothetical protein
MQLIGLQDRDNQILLKPLESIKLLAPIPAPLSFHENLTEEIHNNVHIYIEIP